MTDAPTDDGAGSPAPSSAELTHGVGPWQGELPAGDWWDEELLRDGDRRNVVDKYRYWCHDAIVADLDKTRHSLHIAVENWQHDLNIGSVVRTGNAFNVGAVHIVGRRRWNRRGAMVTDKYQHIFHHPTVEDLLAWAEDHRLTVLGIDNFPDSVPLETYSFPKDCVLLFGQEGPGLSEAAHQGCQAVLSIDQFGSTRSINASAAAAIAMHGWVRQHVFGQTP
ncbi:TrmH family RNA methyltransferase [Saxibacter everestensis]|uniref:TrmH family RNA methyltransferase n=1 Tax=Saxibacter everestensis TaxID=2909229 RepID=A0ABY8QTK4_9MICO|nr:TrmH family RNA methyltransferase [Brevibacteriaceae bacterium ZFBP1038]